MMKRYIIECPMAEYTLRTYYLRHEFYASAIIVYSTSIADYISSSENTQPGDTFVIPGILSLQVIEAKLGDDFNDEVRRCYFLSVVDQPSCVLNFPPDETHDWSDQIFSGATLEKHILLVQHADEVLHGFGQEVESFYNYLYGDPYFVEYQERFKEREYLGAISREWVKA